MSISTKRGSICVAVAMLCSRAFAWSGGTNESDWTQLTNDVATAEAQLENLMVQAAVSGIETNYAYVSKVVIDRFQTFAQYDRDHPSMIQATLADQWWSYKIPNPETYSTELPFDEMAACLEVAGNAIAELQAQLATNIVLQPPVDFSTGMNAFGAGSCLRNGEPVFPSGFNWMPLDTDLMQAFGRIGGINYSLADLDTDGAVKPWALNSDIADLTDQVSRNINVGTFFISHRAADWMETDYPAITDGTRHFVKYDTDSPLIRSWFTNHWSEYLPAVCGAEGDQPRMHLLANEPNFATRTGAWLADNGVSAFTMTNYNHWLQDKYTTIASLNAIYGTAYVDFDAAMDAMILPIDPTASSTIRGGPVWYDWCRFNMDRINDFFQFLKDGVQGYDPLSKPVTIKVLGNQLGDAWRDEGMDMEYLANLMDVTGADLQTVPAGCTIINNSADLEWGWTNTYAMAWTEQSMMLDFYKSLHPDKPFYDSEWHGLETGKWKHFSLDRNYVRAALWLGFTHGINVIQSWVWGRDNDGSFDGVASSFVGGVLTQPTALDAYGRALKELNAHAQAVTDLARADRDFFLYYCEEAAIQDPDYISELTGVYEALKLLNLRVGFTTPSNISSLSVSNQTVIVSPTAFISGSSYSNLLSFGQAGGNVVLVNGATPSFQLNELGFAATGNTNLVPYANANFASAETMADDLDSALDPFKSAVPFQIDVSDYGVLAKQTVDPVSGESSVMLVNVSREPRSVSLALTSSNTVSVTDLITGQPSASVLTMQPCDVLLLGTEDAGANPFVETVIQWGDVGGDTGIVASNQDFAYKTITYQSDTYANPTIGTSYYDSHAGRSPWFNAAASSSFNAKNVNDQPGGDIIRSGKNNATYDAMFIWENELPAGSTLKSLEAETRFSMFGGTGTGSVHWVIQKETGAWYAGAGIQLTQYHADDAAFPTYSVFDPSGLAWFSFTPITDGYGSIGALAAIDMNNIKSVGLYYDLSGSGPNIHADLRYFKAVTAAGSLTGWDEFVADYGLGGAATNDFDMDGESDLYEYALGGNPTNDAVRGTPPSMTYHPDDNVSFYHLNVTNPFPGIVYLSEWTTNLLSDSWSSIWDVETNYPSLEPGLMQSEYQVDGGSNAHLFFRLHINPQ